MGGYSYFYLYYNILPLFVKDEFIALLHTSKILGHVQTSTTMNIYTHSFEEQKIEASVKLGKFLRKNA